MNDFASMDYIINHSFQLPKALEWLEEETARTTNHSRMLAGPALGRLLVTLSRMISPQKIMEIGTFTGYSAICLSLGLQEGGRLDALEKNDMHEALMREAFERAGVSDKITLHFGNAYGTIPLLKENTYDIVFIDGNKREYCTYYNLVFDMVRPGGYILADNVLWYGKVVADQPPKDAQTQEIIRFNEMVKNDSRVECFIFPLRDGLSIIRKLS